LIYDLKDQEIAFEFKLEVWNSQPWDHIQKFIINRTKFHKSQEKYHKRDNSISKLKSIFTRFIEQGFVR
jgi:hypothetical protein